VATRPWPWTFFQRNSYSHRRRLIGGFYACENGSEVVKLGQACCSGKTDNKGLLICDVKAPAGSLILRARTQDGAQWPWPTAKLGGRQRRLVVQCQRQRPHRRAAGEKTLEPGRKRACRCACRSAKHGADLVEREGILDTYVRQLDGREPVLTIPVKPNYAPNVCVRVGRAGAGWMACSRRRWSTWATSLQDGHRAAERGLAGA
jgi:hypothetical protein